MRSNVTNVNSNYVYVDTNFTVTPPTVTTSVVELQAYSKNFIVNVSNPKIKNVLQPHSFRKIGWSLYMGKQLITRKSGAKVTQTQFTSGVVENTQPLLHTAPADDTYNLALAKVYDRLRSSTDLSISIAEAGQTFKMLKSAVSLAHLMGSVHPKNWSKRVVEFQLGWKPLIMDIYGTAKEIMRTVPEILSFQERASQKDDRVLISRAQLFESIRNERSYFRTHIHTVYRPSQGYIDNLSRFTSLNPVSVAWELMPFSFLFDYVINVGSYLRMAESSVVLSGQSLYGSITGTSWLRTDDQRTGIGNIAGTADVCTGQWSGFIETKTKNRSVFTSLPLPRPPVFRPNLGASRLVTVIALLDVIRQSPNRELGRNKMTFDQRLIVETAKIAKEFKPRR